MLSGAARFPDVRWVSGGEHLAQQPLSVMLTRAAVSGMQQRGKGTIINVAGMIAFSGPAPSSVMPRRAVYAGGLAYAVAMPQTLTAEVEGTGVRVRALCPGVVATEFHQRQGMDLSAVPRMSADDVVTASLRGLDLGEVVVAPGVEEAGLLQAVFAAELAAFAGQSLSWPRDTAPPDPQTTTPPAPADAPAALRCPAPSHQR